MNSWWKLPKDWLLSKCIILFPTKNGRQTYLHILITNLVFMDDSVCRLMEASLQGERYGASDNLVSNQEWQTYMKSFPSTKVVLVVSGRFEGERYGASVTSPFPFRHPWDSSIPLLLLHHSPAQTGNGLEKLSKARVELERWSIC